MASETNATRSLSVRVSKEAYAQVAAEAERRGLTLTELLLLALRESGLLEGLPVDPRLARLAEGLLEAEAEAEGDKVDNHQDQE